MINNGSNYFITILLKQPDYSQGRGFYTNATEVANLLQVPVFSSSTYLSTVGAAIKEVEGIDDKAKGLIDRYYKR